MEKSDYNFSEKLLHHLVLGVPLVGKLSFAMDSLADTKCKAPSEERHVFISGLARAGTTVLMRAFYASGAFRSLTYRDMPFVLMPRLWKMLSQSLQRHKEAEERAHCDGIQVNFDSPEAFEEVFWRTFSDGNYISDDGLRPHVAESEIIEQFQIYVQHIVESASSSKQSRYLSKNNNNILRLPSVLQAFPNALILIPFRDPLQQAISLLMQHKKFCGIHEVDHFSKTYMNWLGHHEFGTNHKPFRLEKNSDLSLSVHTANNINYWLSIWINVYRYLLHASPSDSFFVCYEDLCKRPVESITYLFKLADISLDKAHPYDSFIAPPNKTANEIDQNLMKKAQQIYQELRAKASVRANNFCVR